LYQQCGKQVSAAGDASRDTLVWLADEPQRPNPQCKATLRPIGAGVRGGVCRFATAVADVGVYARAREAMRGLAGIISCPNIRICSSRRIMSGEGEI